MVKMETSLEAAKLGRILRMMSWKMWFQWVALSTQSDLVIDIMTNLRVELSSKHLEKVVEGLKGLPYHPHMSLHNAKDKLDDCPSTTPIWPTRRSRTLQPCLLSTERRIYAEFSSKLLKKGCRGTQRLSVAPSHVVTWREGQAWWLSKHHTRSAEYWSNPWSCYRYNDKSTSSLPPNTWKRLQRDSMDFRSTVWHSHMLLFVNMVVQFMNIVVKFLTSGQILTLL